MTGALTMRRLRQVRFAPTGRRAGGDWLPLSPFTRRLTSQGILYLSTTLTSVIYIIVAPVSYPLQVHSESEHQ